MEEDIRLYDPEGGHRDFDITQEGRIMAGRVAIQPFGPEGDFRTVVYHDRTNPLEHDTDIRPGGSPELLADNAWVILAITRAVLGEGAHGEG